MALPELIAESPRMLVALREELGDHLELTVFRSPWVRNTDPLFQKVVSEVESKCVTVVEKARTTDPKMMLRVSESYVLRAWAECPGEDHHCCGDPDHIETVFGI